MVNRIGPGSAEIVDEKSGTGCNAFFRGPFELYRILHVISYGVVVTEGFWGLYIVTYKTTASAQGPQQCMTQGQTVMKVADCGIGCFSR